MVAAVQAKPGDRELEYKVLAWINNELCWPRYIINGIGLDT